MRKSRTELLRAVGFFLAIVAALLAATGSLNAQPQPITHSAGTHVVTAGATESRCAAEWQPAQNGPPAEDLYSVAYGNGLYLAAGYHGTLLTSPDGLAWTPRTSGTTYSLKGLAYGGGQYVAVDNWGSVLTSPDGLTWTTRIASGPFSSVDLESVAYGSGRFVVVGSDFGPFAPFAWTTLTSTDGVNWQRQKGGGFALGGVTYGNGLFVAVGNDSGGPGAVVTSFDGTNWTRRSAGTGQYLRGVAFGGGQFVALGTYGSLLTSTNGIAWTDNTIGPGTFGGITYGAGQFVAVGSDGRILTSPDGTTWTTRTSNIASDLNAVSYGGGQFLAVGEGGTVLSSEDAQTWTNRAWWTQTLNGVAFGAGAYVAVGQAGTILTSPDGSVWTSQMSGTTRALRAVAFGGNQFVTVGASGTILTSPDGITWTNRLSGTTSDLYGVAYGRGQFVAVGSSLPLTSPDGNTWTVQPGGATSYAVAWGHERFVAVGPFGQIQSSADGRTWTYWYSGIGNEFYGIAYGVGVYVAVGAAGIIMTSADGSTWTARASGTSGNLYAVAYGGGQFIAVGCGFLENSADGLTWSFAQGVNTSVCSKTVVYGPGQFVTAGGSAGIARNACAEPTNVLGFVPIVLDVLGLAHYTSELQLTNLGVSSTTVNLSYTGSVGSGTGDVTEAIPAGQQVVYPDAISYLRFKGVPIPTSGDQGGTLLLSSSAAGVRATVRTAADTVDPQPVGRAGLAYSDTGPAASSSVTKLYVYGLRTNDADRSNLAVYNMGQDPVSLKVTLVSGDDGSSFEVTAGVPRVLPAYGWYQYSGVLNAAGFSSGYAIVERVTGSGPFGAYGVVNDQKTNDGSFIPATSGTLSGSRLTIPVLVETSAFESELILTNRGSTTATFTLRYFESISPAKGAGGTTTVDVAAGRQRIIPKAIDFLRSKGISIGARGEAGYAGILQVQVSGVGFENVFAGARTSSLSLAGGEFGVFYPGTGSSQEFSELAFLLGLKADVNNRSNVAVLHTGDGTSGPITLELQVVDGSEGGKAVGQPLSLTLNPGQWAQPPGFFASGGVPNGYVRIRRTAGTASWYAYGVINDGGQPGQRTGDGSYVPGVQP